MPKLLHQLLTQTAEKTPLKIAIIHKNNRWHYQALSEQVKKQAQALLGLSLEPENRAAIYLPKQIETVSSLLSVSQAAGVFVPINPVLKAAQVCHILKDCNVKFLITSAPRLKNLMTLLKNCPDLKTIIVIGKETLDRTLCPTQHILGWEEFLSHAKNQTLPTLIDTQMAAILYTSGSTGKPKGVVISHLNIVTGAHSVSDYLSITSEDILLAALPLSFDYGLNQLTSALQQGATCVLLDYLFPQDIIKALENYKITGLAAVPPLWAQLSSLDWPKSINQSLRYMTNSGGKMPKAILSNLHQKVPKSKFYLMYGLTEAFRSTYLPPEQIQYRPDSIGKAIPNAEILVVKSDGSLCSPGETGELVHKGSLVTMGYWNNIAKTKEHFKPAPAQRNELPLTEIAVWSGDQVQIDTEGYLYFMGRKDAMLKTSGYRVSPTEIEDVIYHLDCIQEAVAIGIPHKTLGQVIIVIVSMNAMKTFDESIIIEHCRTKLANYMVPARIIERQELPKNANGKIDRHMLMGHYSDILNTQS